jgi:hypothetical protein
MRQAYGPAQTHRIFNEDIEVACRASGRLRPGSDVTV